MDAFFDRRKFVWGIGGSLIFTGCKTEENSQALADNGSMGLDNIPKSVARVRQRWIPGKSQDVKDKFIQAVTWLKENDKGEFPADDPRSYLTWNRFIEIHDKSCYHANWYLVPWHRHYVNFFELACQYALQDPTFALPYWDWGQDQFVPDEFFDVPVLQNTRKMKKGEVFRPGGVSQERIDKCLALEDFYQFYSRPEDFRSRISGPAGGAGSATGQFEGGPHNFIHNEVGGNMSNNTSPTDPIFWLHHSNFERLWILWQLKHPNTMPYVTAGSSFLGSSEISKKDNVADIWLDHTLSLSYDNNGTLQPTLSYQRTLTSEVKVRDILDWPTLGYTYDTLPAKPAKPLGHIAIVLKPIKRETVQLEGQNEISDSSLKTSFTDGKGYDATVFQRFQDTPKSFASFFALNLQPPKNPREMDNLEIRFFISTNSDKTETSIFFKDDAYKLPNYLSTFSFFAMEHVHQDGTTPGPQNTQVDLTAWLKKNPKALANKSLTLIAVAVDVKNKKAVPFFKDSKDTQLVLQFDLADRK